MASLVAGDDLLPASGRYNYSYIYNITITLVYTGRRPDKVRHGRGRPRQLIQQYKIASAQVANNLSFTSSLLTIAKYI